MRTRIIGLFIVLAGLFQLTIAQAAKNVIVFIGDGMGYEQVEAARCFKGADLSFESFPYQAECQTYSANAGVTDSAAAGTALATGFKVDNGVISMAIPGDGSELQTLLEYFQIEGKDVGLITTAYLTHATPATFGAHEPSRGNYDQIANDYLTQTRPNVLFGGGGNGLTLDSTIAAGYTVTSSTEVFLSTFDLTQPLLSAQFGSGYMTYEYPYSYADYPYPHLNEMVSAAIEALADDPDGFFLMVEGGRVDHACHSNLLPEAVHEALELSRAVQVALDWASANAPDTLILVTADHETGGLNVLNDNGPGAYPTVSWSGTGHTGVNVPVYAWGPNAQLVGGVMDNTDMFGVCTWQDLQSPPGQISNPDPANGAMDQPLDITLSWSPAEGAESYSVYLGIESGNLTLLAEISQTSFDPGLLDYETTYYWRVDATNSDGTTAGAELGFSTVAYTEPEPSYAYAIAEQTLFGVQANNYVQTLYSDDEYEILQEVINVPNKNGYSVLDHTWEFSLEQGGIAAFYVEAWYTANGENDEFVFSYSLDNITFTEMLRLSETSGDTNRIQFYEIPGEVAAGTFYVKVTDTDHTRKNQVLDTVYIDHMFVVTSGEVTPHYEASFPSPEDGAVGVSTSPLLSWIPGDNAVTHLLNTSWAETVSLEGSITEYQVDGLDAGASYSWSVDEVQADGTITYGPIWSFTTAEACTPGVLEAFVVTDTIRGAAGTSFGVAYVTVVDNCGNLIEGASVTGSFTGDFNESSTEVTAVDGVAFFQTTTSIKKPSFGFVVESVE